jgi:DNA polymerase-3 subunit alpha
MKKEKAGFIKRGAARSFDANKVAELFDLIEHFAGYGFNKSHSAAYAMIAFQTAYLKANYRTEFMAGLLSTKSQRTEDVARYIANCRDQGIDVLGPDINESNEDFTITKDGKIRFGLAAIKGLGEAALKAILEARANEGGAFKDVFHAIKSADIQKANKRVWESLVKAGAFDSLEPNRAAILNGLPSALENAGKGGANIGLVSLFDDAEIASLGDSWNVPEDVEPWSRTERLQAEREILGLYVSGHPLEEYVDAMKIYSAGSLAYIKEQAAAGRLKDKDEIFVAGMVSAVSFKKNKNGEDWAILTIEDLTDKAEALLMASVFEPSTRQRTTPYKIYKDLAMPSNLLRIMGELRVETNDNSHEAEDESGAEVQVKVIVKRLEHLANFQGRGITGALVSLPQDSYPQNLLHLLKQYGGNLPLTLEYKTGAGETVKIKAEAARGLGYNPGLADTLKTETGCTLKWLH